MLQRILDIFRGKRPDITPAQVVSGVPILAELLHSFGVYTLTAAQQDSLSKAAIWALGLLGADTVLRAARGHADAKVSAAAVAAPGMTQDHVEAVAAAVAQKLDASVPSLPATAGEPTLPTDLAEFSAGTGPDDEEGALESRARPDDAGAA